MKILYWNVRGLNNAGKIQSIKDYSQRQRCDIICLLEHKIKQNLQQVVRKHWQGFDVADNHLTDPSGSIMVLWNPSNVTLTKIAESKQFILLQASSPFNNSDLAITVIYGCNDLGLRWEL